MVIKYNNIKAEFKRLGLQNKQVADILNISVSGLDKRIKQGNPSIHLITFALANYYGDDEDNLIKEMDRDL
jgi:transcriptional regulator with XRE-family HTH domain